MGQALYRKYRSRKLGEIVGQDHITKTLSQALKQGRISHAYLLTGPRGVGKTSIARILAHEINGLPYSDDTPHIDIIEIDAASNRRIDEIRELREKVHVAPTSAKYKVYIIDEVHMLTREAFNALLKTLEEPPAHAVFILATTDAHKLPETIVSRTQRFSFKPVDKDEVVEHLAAIAKQEKIKISREALELLAEHGEGSFRDSISMLDQVSSGDKAVELTDVQRQLGLPPAESISELLKILAAGTEASSLMQTLSQLYDQGYQPAAIAKQLSQVVRAELTEDRLSLERRKALVMLSQLINIPASHDPTSLLEIVLLSILQPAPSDSIEPTPIPKATAPTKKTETASPPADKMSKKKPSNKAKIPLDDNLWPQVLAALKQKHNTLYGVARMAQPSIVNGGLQLAFAFAFHQKRLNEAGNRQLLLDTVTELTDQAIVVECIVDEPAEPLAAVTEVPAREDSPGMSAISNIFGGGELLES